MRLVMMGTGTFAEPTFEALLNSPHQVVGLATQPDRPTGQERGTTRQTGRGLKNMALEKGIAVLQPESINTPEGVTALRALQPEMLVVAAYGQILSTDVLAVAPNGGINVHASLLPKYRGAAPVAWAIYHGETRTGVSIIKMSVHLDAGAILGQEAIEIGPDETAGEVEAQLARLGAQLALRVIDETAAGTARGIPQDKRQATKAPKLTKEHGQIDWSRPAMAICDHIRAMQPWPTAYTYLHSQKRPPVRLILSRATAGQEAVGSLSPGYVVVQLDDATRFRIAAGDGTVLEVLELQPAGKRRMSAAEFLRGHRLQPGDRLGPVTP
jgi:methionyl-tRNA formyltransferase